MVLEELPRLNEIRHRPYLALIFGFFFTICSFFVSWLFFRSSISIAMIFLITFLLIPIMIKMINIEEKVESKFGLRHFFSNHKDIFEIYLYSFIGVFLGFLLLGATQMYNVAFYNQLFDFQIKFLELGAGLSSDVVSSFVTGSVQPTMDHFLGVLVGNLGVLIICFILSFFYGASAVFLIILNASVFANFVLFVVKSLQVAAGQAVQVLLFTSLHLLPEISGFLIAAIAGGVVSKAVMSEKKGTTAFKNVFKDATMLMIIAAVLIAIGAVLEVFVTTRLFVMFF